MSKMKNEHRVLDPNPEGKRLLKRPKHRCRILLKLILNM
jgi:hypothetical protein